MQFKKWINENKIYNGISKDDINYWANYAANINFASEQQARNWLFSRLQHGDKSGINVYGELYNKQFSDNFPIYMSGKSFKIGKRIRKDNRFRANSLEIRRPGLEQLNMTAQASQPYGKDYKFLPLKWIRILIDKKNDYYFNSPQEMSRIKQLAYDIKNNGWIEAIIYDSYDLSIIEGQHRARAMLELGFKTVPGIGIDYY